VNSGRSALVARVAFAKIPEPENKKKPLTASASKLGSSVVASFNLTSRISLLTIEDEKAESKLTFEKVASEPVKLTAATDSENWLVE
jgi:hypothetical protein